MNKKFLAMVLTGTMTIALAAGCSNKDAANVKLTDYSSYATLGDYTDLSIEVASAEVTEKQFEEAKAAVIKNGTTKEELTEGTVKDKDSINFDFTGYLDDEAFENGSATDYDYTIGGSLISDLNDQLIGLECGVEYSLNCTFPDNYSANADLAGKEVVFVVTVNCIYGDDIVPEWNDEFINTFTKGEYTTVADYEKYMNETLLSTNESTQNDSYISGIWATILENAEIKEEPQDKIDELYDSMYTYYNSYYTYYASMYGTTYESFLSSYMGMTDDQLKEICQESAKLQAEYIALAYLIADKEGITVSQEEYDTLESEQASTAGFDTVEELLEEYGEDYVKESILDNLILERVQEFLEDKNEMVVSDSVDDEETTTAAE